MSATPSHSARFEKLLILLFLFSPLFSFCTISEGPKSFEMFQQLDNHLLLNYDAEEEILRHRGIDYCVLKGAEKDFSQTPIICIGSSPLGREFISLNPFDSPLLDQKYRELLISFPETNPLRHLLHFVEEEVFDCALSTEETVSVLIDHWAHSSERDRSDFAETASEALHPVIPLDFFIEKKIGVCRHHALITAYFLDRLSKEGKIPSGTSYYVRDVIHTSSMYGGHAWNLYLFDDSTEVWHLDAYWGVLKNLTLIEDLKYLYKAYSRRVIDRERERFLRLS
jgi:hypothetical protein